MKQHSCRTYFRIIGSFDTEAVLDALKLTPSKIIRKGDRLPTTNRIADWDEIDVGFCNDYHVNLNVMLRETIKALQAKIGDLAALRESYQLKYYLVAVPEIQSGNDSPNPILSLEEDIVEFLYLTKTKMDLDYYIY